MGGSKIKHGHARPGRRSREYSTWTSMIDRSTNPNNPQYKDYGGRGIQVCSRWQHSFEHFLSDMGKRPKGKTLDRFPNKDGDYKPSNCRWASWAQQHRNTSRNITLTYQGKTKCLKDWAQTLNINYNTLLLRFKNWGGDCDRMFKTPIGKPRGRYTVTWRDRKDV